MAPSAFYATQCMPEMRSLAEVMQHTPYNISTVCCRHDSSHNHAHVQALVNK